MFKTSLPLSTVIQMVLLKENEMDSMMENVLALVVSKGDDLKRKDDVSMLKIHETI